MAPAPEALNIPVLTRRPCGWIWLCALLMMATGAGAAHATTLTNIRFLHVAHTVDVVFTLSGTPTVHYFTLSHPDRVVVDLRGAGATDAVYDMHGGDGVIRGTQIGLHPDMTRIVFDLRRPVAIHYAAHGTQVFMSFVPVSAPARAKPPARHGTAPPRARPPMVVAAKRPRPLFVVAVDPGHGGRDPGATGPDGLHEKTVTLRIGRDLAALINQQAGMKAVLTRDGDYYVGLDERRAIARAADANLFISIHCNASPDPHIEGAAVYALSLHGASSVQAQLVANRENAAGATGGLHLRHDSRDLAATLVSISQSASIDASFELAHDLLTHIATLSPLWQPHTQRANFVVLRSPTIPSVLVETDFITNPREERLLASPAYEEDYARRLLAGIEGYAARYYPHNGLPLTARAGGSPAHRVRYSS
ncbi:MAG TPA: N-acetylmuramoyl-L-alanine amidase [Nevskiaceae bacterium]